MRSTLSRIFVIIALVTPLIADADMPAATDRNRQILNAGYSMLYIDASHLELTRLVLLLKFESNAVHDIVTDVARFGGRLKDDLDRIARNYPAVRIDQDPLPEIERRKRAAIAMGRAREFAPGIGTSGRRYERTLLIGLSNGINHERHLCHVMADEETDPGLRKFLLDTAGQYDALYVRIDALLDREYFRNPNGTSKD